MSSLRSCLLLTVALTGCASATPSTAAPSTQAPASQAPPASGGASAITDTECPPDVVFDLAVEISCAYLTVPENRSAVGRRSIRLFVTRTRPAETRAADPMLLIGADLGWSPMYGVEYSWRPRPSGEGVLADRVGREVINLDLRGVGHSEPRLACGNVDRLRLTAPGTSTGDPNFTHVLLAEVRACRDDYATQGIDLSAYNIAEMAADVEDLRVALDIEQWNLEALGDSSGVAYEVLRRYPGGLRTVVLDVPSPPDTDRFSTAIVGIRYSLANIVEDCNAQPPCGARYPDMPGTLYGIFERLRAEPAVINPGPDQYVMNDTTILRMLTEGLSEPWGLPGAIYRVANEGPGWLAEGLKDDPVLAHGYTWAGMDAPNLMYGAFYSTLCHDELPFVDKDALNELAEDEPWLVDAFANSSSAEICDIWDVGSALEDPHRAVSSDVRVLVLGTRYSPHAAFPLLEEETAGLSHATLINVRHGNYNLLSDDQCGISIRNQWLEAPDAMPDTSCIEQHTSFDP